MNPIDLSQNIVLAVAAAALLATAGCGSSGDDSTGDDARAAFIAEADELCTQSAKSTSSAVDKRLKNLDLGESGISNEQLEAIFTEITLPASERLFEKIGDLSPPPDDEEEIDAIVKAGTEAVKESEADPEKLAVPIGAGTPFDEVNRLEQKYGFEVCGAADDPQAEP